MPCNLPITAYYSQSTNPDTGKRPLVFNPRHRYTGHDSRYSEAISVPCQKCHGCRADQALMWSIRGYHEASLHKQNCFVTLTYADDHLPSDNKIDKTHVQKFFKALRRDGSKIRYIACGEYGGLTRRPHYHAIIFGRDYLENSEPIGNGMYTHPALLECWRKGHISIAPVTMASICYVCGYVNKKIDDTDTFSLMSRRPGIGHKWLDLYGDDIKRTGVVSIEGRQYQVPKRYLEWHEEELSELKKERAAYARSKNNPSQSIKNFYDQNGRELNLKAKVAAKKLQGKI